MQAPKDGDDRMAAWRPSEPPGQGSPAPQSASNNVTGSCGQGVDVGPEMRFSRGLRKGIEPYICIGPRWAVGNDVATYHMGAAMVTVSGLEMLQAVDHEALGYIKGQQLKQRYMADRNGEVLKSDIERSLYSDDKVPGAPQVASWSGGASEQGSYGSVRLNLPSGERDVLYVRASLIEDALHRLCAAVMS